MKPNNPELKCQSPTCQNVMRFILKFTAICPRRVIISSEGQQKYPIKMEDVKQLNVPLNVQIKNQGSSSRQT